MPSNTLRHLDRGLWICCFRNVLDFSLYLFIDFLLHCLKLLKGVSKMNSYCKCKGARTLMHFIVCKIYFCFNWQVMLLIFFFFFSLCNRLLFKIKYEYFKTKFYVLLQDFVKCWNTSILYWHVWTDGYAICARMFFSQGLIFCFDCSELGIMFIFALWKIVFRLSLEILLSLMKTIRWKKEVFYFYILFLSLWLNGAIEKTIHIETSRHYLLVLILSWGGVWQVPD